jgi:hypothetical protein
MKLIPGILLVVLGTLFVAFAVFATAFAMPSSLDGRAVMLMALVVAGVALEFLGVRDLLRARRSAAPATAA